MRIVYSGFLYADDSLSVAFYLKVTLDKMVEALFFFFFFLLSCTCCTEYLL